MLRFEKLSESHRDAVRKIELRSQDVHHSGSVAAFLEHGAKGVDRHVILKNCLPVGFFKVDLTYAASHMFCPVGALGLRAVAIDKRLQGQGVGTQVMTKLLPYLSRNYRHYHSIYLTVSCQNKAAIRCYLKAGLEMTGLSYLGHAAEPQHVMKASLLAKDGMQDVKAG